MPIDHTAIYVQSDSYQNALKIYTEALKPLGYEIGMQFGPEMTGGVTVTGFSADSGIPNYKPTDFWVTEVKVTPNAPCHMAFKSKGEFGSKPVSQCQCSHPWTQTARAWMLSTRPLSKPAPRTMGPLEFGLTTMPITTPLSSLILPATTSRQFATRQNEHLETSSDSWRGNFIGSI
jgi:hypothetical protein